MQQHPVPQNISSYQFRLVGDMTLKQFLQLLGGGVIAFIFFSTNLPSPIKWFFIIISLLLAAGFAFMPLEGRSLDKWLLAFIQAIYKPTQFHWKKTPKLPEYLSSSPTTKTTRTTPPPKQPLVKPLKNDHETKLHQQEVGRLDQINQMFSSTQSNAQPTTLPPPATPTPKPSRTVAKKAPVLPPRKPVTPKPIPDSSPKTSIDTAPIKTVKIAPTNQSTPTTPKPPPTPKTADQPKPIQGTIIPTPPTTNDSVVTANLNPNLPFPSLPEKNNTLVGMVFTKKSKIIDNAIIEVQDQSHHTVRATKTNKIGQFFLATPLDKGSYFIKTEKEGFSFNIISIQLEDKIYPPIEIRAN